MNIKKVIIISIVVAVLLILVVGTTIYVINKNKEKSLLSVVGYYDANGNEINVKSSWYNTLFQQSTISVDGGLVVEGVSYIALEITAVNDDTVPLNFVISSYGVSGGSTDNAPLIATFVAGDNSDKLNIPSLSSASWLSGVGINALPLAAYEGAGSVTLSTEITAISSVANVRDVSTQSSSIDILVEANPGASFTVTLTEA